MTYPRCTLVPLGSSGVVHGVSRCVRRAFLCGEDREVGRNNRRALRRIEFASKRESAGPNPAQCPPVIAPYSLSVLRMSQAEYLGLVDFSGRQIRADKRGAIVGLVPAVVTRLGMRSACWTRRVMAVGSGFGRAIGEVESLIEKARAMGSCWLRGIGTARALAKVPG